jgi:hypothetical protein
MSKDAVIGCDAVDAGADWLRLHTSGGALRTIPWSTIRVAGLGGDHEGSVTIGGITEIVKPYFRTHDSLWIDYGKGFAQVMIERSGPERTQLIETFQQQLGDRWRGDQLASSELIGALMKSTFKPSGLPKMMILMVLVMFGIVLLAIVVAMLGKHQPQ